MWESCSLHFLRILCHDFRFSAESEGCESEQATMS